MRKKLQEKKKQWMEWLTGLFARGKELIKTVREHMAELSREQELEERKGIKADDPLCGGTPSCTVCILCADAAWVDRSGTGGFHASNLSGWTVYLTPSWEGI